MYYVAYQDWSLTFGWKALIESRNKSCPPARRSPRSSKSAFDPH